MSMQLYEKIKSHIDRVNIGYLYETPDLLNDVYLECVEKGISSHTGIKKIIKIKGNKKYKECIPKAYNSEKYDLIENLEDSHCYEQGIKIDFLDLLDDAFFEVYENKQKLKEILLHET